MALPRTEELGWLGAREEDAFDLDRALSRLEEIDPRKTKIVELRVYLGIHRAVSGKRHAAGGDRAVAAGAAGAVSGRPHGRGGHHSGAMRGAAGRQLFFPAP